jgi:C1A family cysteine protease
MGLKSRVVVHLVVVSLCVLVLLLAGAGAAVAGSGPSLSAAPLDPAFTQTLIAPALVRAAPSSVYGGLGEIPTPVDRSYAIAVPTAAAMDLGTLPSSYDLRPSRVTSVRNQNPYGTCWAFASLGSLESNLLPTETRDFSEDNLVLQAGFSLGTDLYNTGGNMQMATAYLARWGGPVNENDDAYGDSSTPPGLSARMHVQEVDWILARPSALDNDAVKTAVMQYGGVYASMGWYDSAYKPSTTSYYYTGTGHTNHGVLIVGWDDSYAASNFATTPGGNGAFVVKNSWGSGWGASGYFYVSYYDVAFGRSGELAVFRAAEPTTDYSSVYQYDPLGEVTDVGFQSTTAWFANVFTATSSSQLSAVGFYTLEPGTTYEVYTGTSLASRTLRTSSTMAYMGYHTVVLPLAVPVTGGQQFVVMVKVSSPTYRTPVAVERAISNYSSGATAAAGQSFLSASGSTWQDLTTTYDASANVCLKAFVKATAPAPAPTITGFTPSFGPAGTVVTIAGADLSGATGVTFNGLAATSYTVDSATQVRATVPAGATTGKVAVTTPGGTGTSAGDFTVTAPTPTPTITVTAPTGTDLKAAGSGLAVTWSTSESVSTGEFAVWAVSASGWYVGKLVPQNGTAGYGTNITLSVPAGGPYSVKVGYRPAAGSGAWAGVAASSGTFTVYLPLAFNVSAPTGTQTLSQGSSVTVSWTANQSVSSGEFAVWAVSASGWYVGKLVPQDGTASYSTSLPLTVPVGAAYSFNVGYRTTAGSGAWAVFGASSGTVNVTAAARSINVTAPTGSSSKAQNSALAVSWTTSQSVSTGEFAVWAVSASGWYVGKLVPQNGTADYGASVTLSVPSGGPYSVKVGYRATAGSGAWAIFGASSGTFTIYEPLAVTVIGPNGSQALSAGSPVTVSWTTNENVSSGEFAVWAVSASGWYVGKVVAQDGTASYSTSLSLNVPGGGVVYSFNVGYRAGAGAGSWTTFGVSPGTVTVN